MQRSWNLLDFVLVVMGGFLGAAVAFGVSLLVGGTELMLLLGLLGQYAGHLLVLWLLSRRRTEADLAFRVEPGDILYLPLGLLMQLVLAVLFLPLTNLLFPDGESAQQIGDAISALTTSPGRIGAVLLAVVVAPVVEELTFRGVLLKALSRQPKSRMMITTALVFAAFHFLGLDPNSMAAAAAVVLPQLFVVGIVLAWLTLRSGRLGPAIFAHSGFNLLAAIALLIPSDLLSQLN